ncbi:hypothetical protein KIPB_013614, partial [Kipferlia bialata]
YPQRGYVDIAKVDIH